MLLTSPPSLHYPITVTELLKQVNDHVDKHTPIFSYFYKSQVVEGNRYGEETTVEKTFPTRFESEADGSIVRWKIAKGTVIPRSGVGLVEIEEACRHDIQFGGMCADCGMDMTAVDYNTSRPDSARASINMTHANTALRISQDEAARVEEEAKRRLLQLKKLTLVVDLDQTIIHATVDPTVAEWQSDPSNPNYEAVSGVRSFQLLDDGPGRGCWYYIKLRPRLAEFLENVSKLYELHIYTMGTRAYALNIAKIIDPEGRFFADRILSRDESGSLVAKNLQRLFPVDTKMVAIIDDRGDVWNWNANLIKVTPYDFFVGIGDINSSFLPKRQEIPKDVPLSVPTAEIESPVADQESSGEIPAEEEPKRAEEIADISVNGAAFATPPVGPVSSSTLEQLVSMSGPNDAASLQQRSEQQGEELAAQVTDRPLLQKQKRLDAADKEAKQHAAAAASITDESERDEQDSQSESQRPRHNLLQDDDTELFYLEQNLAKIHRKFYDSYTRNKGAAQGGRVAELRGENAARKGTRDSELAIVPDVKELMPDVKKQVLKKCNLVFTGVVPLGVNIWTSDIGRWASSFGASISSEITKETTHVIASRERRTAKVRQAAKTPRIKIVTTSWLFECFTRWEAVKEDLHLIEVEQDGEVASKGTGVAAFEDLMASMSSDGEDLSEEEEEDDMSSDTERVNGAIVAPPENIINDQAFSSMAEMTHDDWKEMMEDIGLSSGSEDSTSEESRDDDVSEGGLSQVEVPNKKRKRDVESRRSSRSSRSGDESDENVSDSRGSKLQQRKRQALSRTSSLTKVTSLSGVAEQQIGLNLRKAGPTKNRDVPMLPDNEDDGADDLEADLEAELQAQLDEDSDDGGD